MATWIEKVKDTKERHQLFDCKTFELKLDKSHLSIEKLSYLKMLFVEAKWLYNYILSTENIFEFDTKSHTVIVLNKDKQPEERKLEYLSSQMKQSVQQKLTYAVKSLAAKKKKLKQKKKKTKGNRIGKIKFTSECKAIVLNQYNRTYRFINKRYLKLQGCKHTFRIQGLEQISESAEVTCATLCYRHNDYYLKVTCYVPKEEINYSDYSVGIDFGISTALTLTTGEKYDLQFPEHKRLRRLRRRMSRKAEQIKKKKVSRSKNYLKLKTKVNKEYHKLTNRKKDKKNKLVRQITRKYQIICVQDENIVGWHAGNFGKQVQHSLMGGIISGLERKSHTFIKVDKFFPSTQLCPICSHREKLTLEERTYICPNCGYKNDRDVKAAICIEREGLKQIRREPTKSTLLEIQPLLSTGLSGSEQVESLKEEAPAFRQR